jgi:N-methylhydantoinase A
MRYGEQIFELRVDLEDIDWQTTGLLQRFADAFHCRHEQLYTYALPDQEAVLVNARVAVIGELPSPPREPDLPARAPAPPIASRRVYLGDWQKVPVFELEALASGQTIEGPAIVESPTTTVLLRPGDLARTTPIGWLDITVGAA